MIIQIIYPRKRILVLDGCLVDRAVVLDQTVCSIALLDKEGRCSPGRGTGANELFAKCLIDFLLQLKEFVRWHLIWALSNWGCAGLQVNNKLDSSYWGYSWKFFRKDVGEIANNGNVLDSFKGGCIQRIESKNPRFGISHKRGGVVHNLTGRVKELDGAGATINCSIMGFQPIHSKNEVDGGSFQDVRGYNELCPFNLDGDVRGHQVNSTLATGCPDS